MASKEKPKPDWHLECQGPVWLVAGSYTSCHDWQYYQAFVVAYAKRPAKGAFKATVPNETAHQIWEAVREQKQPESLLLEFRLNQGEPVWDSWRLRRQNTLPGASSPVAEAPIP